jgi:protein-S-isoprenylcysteine O-methyltransferase Ste14
VIRPAFAAVPVANALFLCAVVVWILSEFQQALRRRPKAAKSDRYSLFVLRLCIATGVLLALFALRVTTTSFGFNPVLFGGGLVLIWTGMALRWWSFWTLGRYFTFAVMTSADQPVITTGPYRHVRHPGYAGILLSLAGVGLAFGNWLSLAALLVPPLIGFAYRIRVEEAALSTALGVSYTSYAERRKRVLPFLWCITLKIG